MSLDELLNQPVDPNVAANLSATAAVIGPRTIAKEACHWGQDWAVVPFVYAIGTLDDIRKDPLNVAKDNAAAIAGSAVFYGIAFGGLELAKGFSLPEMLRSRAGALLSYIPSGIVYNAFNKVIRGAFGVTREEIAARETVLDCFEPTRLNLADRLSGAAFTAVVYPLVNEIMGVPPEKTMDALPYLIGANLFLAPFCTLVIDKFKRLFEVRERRRTALPSEAYPFLFELYTTDFRTVSARLEEKEAGRPIVPSYI